MAAKSRFLPLASFGTGEKPTIACVNEATTPLGLSLSALVDAMQTYVDQYFAPVWGSPCRLNVENQVPSGAWGIRFLDDADQAGALGYHELTEDGLPVSYVFVRTTLAAGDKISVTASHELAEMLVDPGIQMWAEGPEGTLWAYETADAVEETDFLVKNIPMSNFVYPSFFESFRKPGSMQFDHLKKVSAPFTLLAGGYSLVRTGEVVRKVFGSEAKALRFHKEDRRMHRSESRTTRDAHRNQFGHPMDLVQITTPTSPVTFANDIRPLFRPKDIDAMKQFGGFDLSSYDDVSRMANDIYTQLAAGAMPCDGKWADANVAKFKQWIDGGKQP